MINEQKRIFLELKETFMQKFEQAVSYIENGEAEKGLQLLKEQLKIANDEEKYDIARYYHTLDLQMRH